MTLFPGLPPDGSAHGAEIDQLMAILHIFMAAVFTAWFIYFLVTLVRYRASSHPRASYRGPRGLFLAATVAVVLVVEIVLDLFFSVPIWSKRSDAFPDPKDATVVRIVAEQYAWNVHYPGPDGLFGRSSADLVEPFNALGLDRDDPAGRDDIALLNRLVVPAGKPVIIHLTSKDVIHSLNIPVYRIKQDAVPGLMSPVWFIPEKTTERIRGEMAADFSVSRAVSTQGTIRLPSAETLDIRNGEAPDDRLALADVADAAGVTILSAGDGIDDADIRDLLAAGITSVRVRRRAGVDMYVSTREYSDRSGTPVLPAHETLTEDAVTALVDAGISEVEARRRSHTDPWLVHTAVVAPDGGVIAGPDTPLDEEIISRAAGAGLATIGVAPATPTEIACAQLCGLGHYQMRATLEVVEPGEYARWHDEQSQQPGNAQ